MNDLDIPALSDDERRAIAEAASAAYKKLRWEVGDSEAMRKELVLLARDSYCAGRAAHIDDLERRLQTAESRAAGAVEAEREACARLCESEWSTEDERRAGQMFAREIRARNEPPKGGDSIQGEKK